MDQGDAHLCGPRSHIAFLDQGSLGHYQLLFVACFVSSSLCECMFACIRLDRNLKTRQFSAITSATHISQLGANLLFSVEEGGPSCQQRWCCILTAGHVLWSCCVL